MYTQTITLQLCQIDEAPFQKTRKASYNLYPGMWLLGEKDVQSRQVKDSIPQLWAGDVAEEQVRQIERLMSEGKYREAVIFGQTVHGDQTPAIETGKDDSRLARAEIDLHYARALVYTGATMEGTALYKAILADGEAGQNPEDVAKQGEPHSLEGSRRNYVLGRDHNDLGYAYLVELGHYAFALQELEAALPYFRASNLWEEYANTCGNIGRVYTQLYQRGPSEEWMDKALKLRLKSGDEYRIALSLRSQAILYLTFGLPERAYHLASEALYICQRLENQRGTGLVCITLGSARRQMANLSIIYSYEQRAKFLEEAEWYLHQAIVIFGDSVAEPVRLLEAQYELGCVYRDWAALVCHEGADPALAAKYERFAVWHLQFTVGLAHESRPLWYVDACLALAQTYLQCAQFNDAHEWLERANRATPSMYILQIGGGLAEIPVEERIEGFWYRMGEIELLRGHLACDRELGNQRQLSREVLVEATEHYALAISYFKHYSSETPELRNMFKLTWSRFRYAQAGDIRYIREQVLPSVISEYGLTEPDLNMVLLQILNYWVMEHEIIYL